MILRHLIFISQSLMFMYIRYKCILYKRVTLCNMLINVYPKIIRDSKVYSIKNTCITNVITFRVIYLIRHPFLKSKH